MRVAFGIVNFRHHQVRCLLYAGAGSEPATRPPTLKREEPVLSDDPSSDTTISVGSNVWVAIDFNCSTMNRSPLNVATATDTDGDFTLIGGKASVPTTAPGPFYAWNPSDCRVAHS